VLAKYCRADPDLYNRPGTQGETGQCEVESNSGTSDDNSSAEESLVSEAGALSFNAVKARRLARDRRRRIIVTALALVATALIVMVCIWLLETGGLEVLRPEER
jgi:hypothetical protein